MTARELIILGTASQVPTRYRNHNGYFLRWDGEGILFDPGEGTQRQMTIAGISASAITKICITHFHGDHCLGLPGIVQRLSLDNCPEVSIYYPASGERYLSNLRNASIYAHLDKVAAHPISGRAVLFESDSMTLEAVPLDHEVECFGYRISERDQLRVNDDRLRATGLRGPAVGKLMREGVLELPDGRTIHRSEIAETRSGQSFAFIMDTRLCAGAAELARGVDLLVCESTFLQSEEDLAVHSGHMTARHAAMLARDAGARKLVLTHFSQRYDDNQAFLAEAQEVHNDVVVAAEPHTERETPFRIAVPLRKQAGAVVPGDPV